MSESGVGTGLSVSRLVVFGEQVGRDDAEQLVPGRLPLFTGASLSHGDLDVAQSIPCSSETDPLKVTTFWLRGLRHDPA